MFRKPELQRGAFAEISEIFSSIQGEGPYLGVRQIFVRFGRCNMHCHYCDELAKMKAGQYEPRSLASVLATVESLRATDGQIHSVSLTGGEPLFYSHFLERFAEELTVRGHKTYLETNGTLPKPLEKVIRWIDIVAMDIKPPSSSQDRAFWKAHEEFLKIAVRKDVFVKIVVTPKTRSSEVARAARMVSRVKPSIPFILQPMSEAVGISSKALERIESELFTVAKSELPDVRVIPQMHKIWGIR